MDSKKAKFVWIGGWACNIACWKDDIIRLYPERRHVFIDAIDLLQKKVSLHDVYSDSGGKDWILAWSMGSLVLHEWLSGQGGELNPDGARFISICPVFHFCRQPGGWRPVVIERMIAKLLRQKGRVLEDFFNRMASRSNLNETQKDSWKQSAYKCSSEQLTLGLEYLMNTEVLPEKLKYCKEKISFLVDNNDPIATLPCLGSLGSHIAYTNQGHVPFLSDPDALRLIGSCSK